MIEIALFQPEIAQNVGTLLRFGACLGVPIHIIEPCGFLMTDKKLYRAGMDYTDLAVMKQHTSWSKFCENISGKRIIATSPNANTIYTQFSFHTHDILLMGMESTGLPHEVIQSCNESIRIPMLRDRRSLNLALSAGIIASEALRQLSGLP